MSSVTSDHVPPITSPEVRQMLAVIKARLSERPSGDDLAKIVGDSPKYLGKLFRQQMGMSVRAYVARTIVERAACAICDGEKVEAVALEAGYRSKKNFYRQFKLRFGTTPARYRATHT
jgi:two-component system, response regulator YesN